LKKIFIALVLFSNIVFTQNPKWVVYNSTNSGLPSNTLYSIAIDTSDNIWLGTDIGLVKFDGTNWTIFNTSNSGILDNSILSICIDNNGTKWIGSWGGVSVFNDSSWIVYSPANSKLPDGYVNAIAIDKQGNKWFGTGQGIVKFDGSTWTIYNSSNSGLPTNLITSICIDSDNNKWIGNGGNLAMFDGTNWNTSFPAQKVETIAIDSNGYKWFGSWSDNGGIARFDGMNWTYFSKSNSGLSSNYIEYITIDKKNNKWVGTHSDFITPTTGGLAKFDDFNWTIFSSSNSKLPDNEIAAIDVDSRGKIWIALKKAGLAVLNEEGIDSIDNTITIQSLINSINPGDTVWLDHREYLECLQINKPLTLIGKGIDQTKIIGDSLKPVITIKSSDVLIKNMTVAAKLKTTYYNPYDCDKNIPTNGIVISSSQNIALDSMQVSGGEDVSINFSLSGGVGLLVENSQSIKISNSKIFGADSKVFGSYRCSKDGGDGFMVLNSDQVRLINCFIIGGQGGTGWSHGATPAKGGYGGNAVSLLNSNKIEINNSHLIGGIGGSSTGHSDLPINIPYQAKAGDGVNCNGSSALFSNSTFEGGAAIFRANDQNVPNTLGGNGISGINHSQIFIDSCILVSGISSPDAMGKPFYSDSSSTITIDSTNTNPHVTPKVFLLKQNYPNPFNIGTKIKYTIPQQSFVKLKVYDLLGREVASLVNEEKLVGIYEIEFSGSYLPSGVYFYRLQSENFIDIKKMSLLK
jgi:hypothetical protein